VCGPEHGGGEVRDLIYPQQVERLRMLPGARTYSNPPDLKAEAALMDEMTRFIDETLSAPWAGPSSVLSFGVGGVDHG
jgi:hypothetical protein